MRTPFPLITACFALIFLFSYSSFAQQASTAKLERRIADLEKRAENLETQLSDVAISGPPTNHSEQRIRFIRSTSQTDSERETELETTLCGYVDV